MRRRQSLWWFAGAVGLVASAGAAETVYMNRYPSSADVRRMQKDGVKALVISPDERPWNPQGLDFPASSLIDRLNDLDQVDIRVEARTGAYPMPANLNKIKGHVHLHGVIDNCLSSSAEQLRLKKVKRQLSVTVLCRTENQVERAERLAAEVMDESPVRVSVRLVRD
jgi:hypothetical protein